MPVLQEEITMLARLLNELHLPNPTQVTDIYKARRSRYKNVRIWSFTDLGTGRMQDLFMTDASFNIIKIDRIEIIIEDDFNKVMQNQEAQTAIIDGNRVDLETAEILEEDVEENETEVVEETEEFNEEEFREEEETHVEQCGVDLEALCKW